MTGRQAYEPGPPRHRLSDLYHRALARTPEERSAFLQEACDGDAALRGEVESLLEYESDSAEFLERPAALIAGDMHFTADPERKSRFRREARLLATLNHPHIGAIYGLEETDGFAALVLDLVEGPTLASLVTRGALPIPEALAIPRQGAEALDAAHQRGIVHRDLKPANIVLQGTPGGMSDGVRAKVVDVGLAKTFDVGLPRDPRAHSTDSLDGTADGRILGTAADMSPQQARGQAVDKRTDIWAFGCVLIEMLTGKQPFEGER